MNAIRKGVLVALLTISIPPVVAMAQSSTLDSVVDHYLKQRTEMAQLIPALLLIPLMTVGWALR